MHIRPFLNDSMQLVNRLQKSGYRQWGSFSELVYKCI